MTITEIFVAVGCLVLGYWLVAVFLPHATRPAQQSRRRPDWQDETGPASRRWWEVLGVTPSASRDNIIAAYKSCIGKYHPDKVATMGPEIREIAQQRSAEINAAYDEAMRQS
jgi:DnaJ-domain-containing protein 1